jgi:hypothetical protein
MKTPLLAVTLLALASAAPATAANDNQSKNRGGADYGPMGQCFDARVCDGRGSYAFLPGGCHMVRERIVTEDGRVIFRRHRTCD